MKVFTIGIAGGTGSGKTTVTRRIREQFGDKVSVLYHDNYYRRHDELSYEERCRLNYDHPDAYETGRLIHDLRELKQGRSIACPVYDFTVHNRSDKTTRIDPAPLLVVEGILILQNRALCREMDLKIFVDTDADVRILRRITRDVRDRGRTLESVTAQYLTTVKPMHERFVEPSKRHANLIIPEGGKNEAAVHTLLGYLTTVLEDRNHG